MKKKLIKREIMILKHLHGGVNIVQLLDIVVGPEANSHSLIFEHIDYVDFKILYPTLTTTEIKYYMFELLKVCTMY